MNIFALSKNPWTAASKLYDTHLSKMILESAQMLCAYHMAFGVDVPYKLSAGHYNHPCVKWVRESPHNYKWLYFHALGMNEERMWRGFSNTHKSLQVILDLPDTVIGVGAFSHTSPPYRAFKKGCPLEGGPSDSWDQAVEDYNNYYRWKQEQHPDRFVKSRRLF
jgi:hypothetical protein